MTTKNNKTIAEKVCFLILIFISIFFLYICGYKIFNFFFPSKETIKFNDLITFSLSVTSLFLALLLYNDWRDQYISESLDKDLREIKALVSDINFIINRFPSSQSEQDVEERAEFFKLYWKLRVLNSYIKDLNLNELNNELESYLLTSHGFINTMLKEEFESFPSITEESKIMFERLNGMIESCRNDNLNKKFK